MEECKHLMNPETCISCEDEKEKPKDFKEHKEKYKEFYKDINNILTDMVTIGSKNKGPKNND